MATFFIFLRHPTPQGLSKSPGNVNFDFKNPTNKLGHLYFDYISAKASLIWFGLYKVGSRIKLLPYTNFYLEVYATK